MGDHVGMGDQVESGVRVTGEGSAGAVPDVMVLDAGVEASAGNPGDAFASAREGLAALRSGVLDAGVAESDLQTSDVSLHPRYNRDGQPDGHVASLGVRIRVREMSESGAVIDAVTSSAGSVARINGIGLEHSRPAELRQRARAAAVVDARSKAEELAALTGRTLGDCQWISEGGVPSPRPMMSVRAEAVSDGMAVDPGQVQVSVQVTAIWAFV